MRPEGAHAGAIGAHSGRDLSWLRFDGRVLEVAEATDRPVLDRARFLAISASNLDEFFMKRIGGLKQQVGAGIQDESIDGRSPQEQIRDCYHQITQSERRQEALFPELLVSLGEHGINISRHTDLSAQSQYALRQYYLDNVFPLVTPQAIDPAHPFPFISNLSLNLFVSLRLPGEHLTTLARVKVPLGAGRDALSADESRELALDMAYQQRVYDYYSVAPYWY